MNLKLIKQVAEESQNLAHEDLFHEKELDDSYEDEREEQEEVQSQKDDKNDEKSVSLHEKLKEKLLDELSSTSVDEDVKSRARQFLNEASDLTAIFCHADDELKRPINCPELYGDNGKKIFESIFQEAHYTIPGRDDELRDILNDIFRRIIGSKSVRTPFLYGAPGTGKSYIVEQLVNIFSRHGIKMGFYRCVCNEDTSGAKQNQLESELLGTECSFSNSQPGIIARALSKADCDYLVVFIDELEKAVHWHRGFFLNLFDPCQNLSDIFFNGVFAAVKNNLRNRVITIAAGNDISVIEQYKDLMDRINPIYFRTYKKEDKIEVFRIINKDILSENILNQFSENQLMEVAKEIIEDNETISIRTLADQVERILMQKWCSFLIPQRPRPFHLQHQRKITLGFRGSC